jgi:hypothetical protein
MFLVASLIDQNELRFYAIYTITYWMCIWVLKTYRIIGAAKGAKVAKVNKRKYADEQASIRFTLTFLERCEGLCYQIGLKPRDTEIYEWNYLLNRCTRPIKSINRRMKAVELLGLLKGIQFIIVLACIYGLVLTYKTPFIIGAVLAFFIPGGIKTMLQGIVKAQDIELENDFPDLYLLLYCKLTAGVNAHIADTLNSYITNMNALYEPDQHVVIRRFVQDLRNQIEVLGDEGTALSKVRENYRSALIVNFCNLACQSLRGVDTKDKLLAFKVELNEKQKELMTREAAARVERGRRSIMLIYAILAEFVCVSWAAKIM